MTHFILIGLLFLIGILYLILSPKDTAAELKLIFDWRMIRRGLRVRPPRLRNLPRIRFSILHLILGTTAIALFFGWVIWQGLTVEQMLGVIVLTLFALSIFTGVAVAVGGRGVLREQRPLTANVDNVRPPIVDIVISPDEPKHQNVQYEDDSFPMMVDETTDAVVDRDARRD